MVDRARFEIDMPGKKSADACASVAGRSSLLPSASCRSPCHRRTVRLLSHRRCSMAPVKVDPDKVREFKDAESFLQLARQAPRQGNRSLDQDPQGRFGARIDHAEGSHRRGALLGLDRRGAQGVRRQELSAALHAARQEKHLEPDQRRQRRPADRGRPDDRARAEAGRGGQGRRALGRAPTAAART